MKKTLFRLPIALIVPFFFLLIFSGCGFQGGLNSDTSDIQQKSAVKVGVTANYPPMIFIADGVISGIEADMAAEVGRAFDVPVEFVEMPLDNLIGALNSGDIDIIMSGISITGKRSEKVRFCEPYYHVGQMAIFLKYNLERFSPLKDLIYVNGLKVGYEKGTTGEDLVLKRGLLADPVGMDSVTQGLKALDDETIDVFIHDTPTAWQVSKDPAYGDLMVAPTPLQNEPLAWAVRKTDRKLCRQLNSTLEEWKKDGTLQRILDKWDADSFGSR